MTNMITGGVTATRRVSDPRSIWSDNPETPWDKDIQALDKLLTTGDYSDFCKLNELTIEQARSISREGLEREMGNLRQRRQSYINLQRGGS